MGYKSAADTLEHFKYKAMNYIQLPQSHWRRIRTYNIKESLQKLWECKNREEAEQYLKKWHFQAIHSRLEAIIEVAKTIKSH